MARPVVLGNGSLTVGLNEQGLVHDFYYPYVGLDNLTTARSVHHKIGIWIDGGFSWVDADKWRTDIDFEPDALVSTIRMHNDALRIALELTDFVYSAANVFARQIVVHNLADNDREIRVFMHQVFEISRGGRADTAQFMPVDHYILDYKGSTNLLIYGQTADGKGFDQYAIGNYGIEGKEGTFRDAEDGELSGCPVEHGGVDFVVRFVLQVPAGQAQPLDYWIIAADNQYNAERIHREVKAKGLAACLQTTRRYWHEWLAIGANKYHAIDRQYLNIFKKSLMIIKVHADKRGGIIASTDSSIYNHERDYYSYMWPRDGAYAIWPLIRLGYIDEPRRFFEFCRDVLHDGYLMPKYQPDQAIGSTWHPWVYGDKIELPIQEDGTALVIYMVGEYLDYSGDEAFVRSLYASLVQPAANFMAQFIDEATGLPHASYDLWEAKFSTHTYTTALVYQALLVSADIAERFGHTDDAAHWRDVAATILHNASVFFNPSRQAFRKSFLLQADGSLKFDDTLDVSSLYGVMMFGMYESPAQLGQTMQVIETQLLNASPSDGVPRFENDIYFGCEPPYLGNPWCITTLWVAQYYLRTGKRDRALHYLQWAIDRALPSGVLSEQVNPTTSAPVSVAPLVWSHAELINTMLDASKLSQHS